jgi:hypothetical protein
MKLTRELIFAGLNCGAANSKQLAVFGLKYPLKHGWIDQLAGKEISEEDYQRFLSLRRNRKNTSEKPWPSEEEWLSFEPTEEIILEGKAASYDLEIEAWL